MLKRELNIFFTAIMFYTRIRVPANIGFSNNMLNKATRYFPLVGLIVGSFGAAVCWLMCFLLPFHLALILSMASTILVTGAFHEDAFSDFCDGFGGGYTPERILEIMKDSRIGTYGATGILLMLLTKFVCLTNIGEKDILLILIAAHAFSRLASVCLIYTSQYVRQDADSKSKPIGHKSTVASFLVASCFGLAPLFFFPFKTVSIIVGLAVLLFIFFRRYIIAKLGGYTGDVLGALQQLTELSFYVAFLICKQHPVWP